MVHHLYGGQERGEKEERKQINKGDIIRAAKENIEQQWKETAVERLVSFY